MLSLGWDFKLDVPYILKRIDMNRMPPEKQIQVLQEGIKSMERAVHSLKVLSDVRSQKQA